MNMYQLKIKINTKIPSHKQFELTNNVLVHEVKSKLSKYPLFTDNKAFPKKLLQNYNYNELVLFFFNNKRFISVMKNINPAVKKNKTNRMNFKNIKQNVTKKNKVDDDTDKDLKQNEITIIKYENFILMLQLLFPTTFPLVNNMETSLSYLLTDQKEVIPFLKKNNNTYLNVTNFFSFKGTNTNLFQPLPKFNRKFSYLKFDNNIYTISHVIWINDVMNHPVYKDILLKYNFFEKWKIKYEENIDQKDAESQSEIVKFINRIMLKTNNPLKLDKIIETLKFGKTDTNNNNNRQSSSSSNNSKEALLYINMISALENLENIRKQTGQENAFTNSDQNKMIIDNFITVMNIFDSLSDKKGIFTTSYENLINIKNKIDEYELSRDINDYIIDLNFEYLNDQSKNERTTKVVNRINTLFPEFNNFVKVIRDMKTREIDNPEWKNTITKIIKGERDHNFQKIWNEINVCYSITDVDNLDEKNAKKKEDDEIKEKEEREKEKKKKMDEVYYNKNKVEIDKKANEAQEAKYRKQKEEELLLKDKQQKEINRQKQIDADILKKINQAGGKKSNKCKNTDNLLNVGFDVIIGNNATDVKEKGKEDEETGFDTIGNLKTIEIYLQMDIIEGKVDEKNMNLLNCAYNDNYLGNMYNNLLYNSKEQWNISEQLMYFPAKEILDKKNKKPEPIKKK